MELLDASDQPGLGEEDLAAVGTDTQTDTHLMELLDVSDQPGLGEEDLAAVITDTQTTDLQTDTHLMELLDVSDQPGLGEEDLATVGALVLELAVVDGGDVELEVALIVELFPAHVALGLLLPMHTHMLVEVGATAEGLVAVRTHQVVADVQPVLLANHTH